MEIRTIHVPGPGRNEVLVRVHASGLNPKDAIVRRGGLRLLTGRRFPRGTGFDCSGEVAAHGAVVPRAWMARMPRRLGWIEGAALSLVGTTAAAASKWIVVSPEALGERDTGNEAVELS